MYLLVGIISMRKIVFVLSIIGLLISCSESKKKIDYTGSFVFNLEIGEETVLPVRVIIDDSSIVVLNSSEKIVGKEVFVNSDSLYFQFPVFNSFITAKFDGVQWKGKYVDPSRSGDYFIPFTSEKSKEKFPFLERNVQLKESYKTLFSFGTEDEYPAIGLFSQNGNSVNGTFRTETGDYRFLDGNVGEYNGKQVFALSCLDGSHAFLFKGEIDQDTLRGKFYSGNHWSTEFIAYEDEWFELEDPDTLTTYQEEFGDFDFTFPNLEGDSVNFKTEYKDQLTIVQIMGSWCPNCMDETKYLADYNERFKAQGVRVVALAFERSPEFEKAAASVKNLKADLNAQYDFLIAGVGNKQKASETLPMLSKILSFPTTLIVDPKGEVRYVHTGFNGPSTGDEYESFVKYFEGFTKELLESKDE